MRNLGLVALALAALTLAACEDRDGARETLLDEGYSDIAFDDPPFWQVGCGRGDYYQSYFHAKGPTGRSVKGVVCSGNTKGETVRLLR